MVILVGTCGAYAGSGLAIGDVVVATRVALASAAAARGDGALLPSMTLAFEPDASLFDALVALGGKPAAVATTLALTTTDSLAFDLQRSLGPDVEHLEAYAVAHVCAAFGVPFAAVLAVANDVGPRGRDQWRAHHNAAEATVAVLVSRWLSARAQAIRSPT
jgi:futalosine hydrolase